MFSASICRDPLFVAEPVVCSYLGEAISEEWPSLPAESFEQLFENCTRLLLAVPKAWNNLFLPWKQFSSYWFFFLFSHIIILKFVCFGCFDFIFLAKNCFLPFTCFFFQETTYYIVCATYMEYRSSLFLEHSHPGFCCLLCWMPCRYSWALAPTHPVCVQQHCAFSARCVFTVEVEAQFTLIGMWKAAKLQMHHIFHFV